MRRLSFRYLGFVVLGLIGFTGFVGCSNDATSRNVDFESGDVSDADISDGGADGDADGFDTTIPIPPDGDDDPPARDVEGDISVVDADDGDVEAGDIEG